MNIRFPEKVRVINSTTRYPFSFLDAGGVAVAPTAATQFNITGYGNTQLAYLTAAKLARGGASANQVLNVTAATAGEITFTAPVVAKRVSIKYVIDSIPSMFAFVRPYYDFGLDSMSFNIDVVPTDTTATFLAKLYNYINAHSETNRYFYFKATGTGTFDAYGKALTITDLNIVAQVRGVTLKIDKFKAVEVDGYTPSTVVTVFQPSVTVAGVMGTGLGFDLEFKEKMQEYNNKAYGQDLPDMFVESELYTEISWTQNVVREEPYEKDYSNYIRSVIYVKESACETVIDNLADFFGQYAGSVYDANVATVYTKGVSNAQFKTNV